MKTKTKSSFDVLNTNNKYIVTKNGLPFSTPNCGGQQKITEFDSKEDAIKYMSILENLNQHERV